LKYFFWLKQPLLFLLNILLTFELFEIYSN